MDSLFNETERYLSEWRNRNDSRVDEFIIVEGMRLFIPRSVFSPDPSLTNSSRQLIAALPASLSCKVLDVGTGCGVLALHAAKRGGQVTATDIDKVALEVARRNAELHSLETKINFLQSDLLDAVSDKFDLVLANLPIVDSAWQGLTRTVESQMSRFLSQLPNILAPEGRCFIPFASFGDERAFQALIDAQQFVTRRTEEARFGVTWSLYELTLR